MVGGGRGTILASKVRASVSGNPFALRFASR